MKKILGGLLLAYFGLLAGTASAGLPGIGLGGAISGLNEDGLILLKEEFGVTRARNSAEQLAIDKAAVGYQFTSKIEDYVDYKVSVIQEPNHQNCSVINGNGSVGFCFPPGDITNVDVSCSYKSYTVAGSVTGLSGSLTLRIDTGGTNPEENLSVPADGPFAFPTDVIYPSNFTVTVLEQPTGQICSVVGGSGDFGAGNVSDVAVSCSAASFSVGGTVAGLTGSLILQNNGGDDHVMAADGTFIFPTDVTYLGGYAVSVSSQPAGQTCSVNNGTGSNVNADVSDIAVACTTDPVRTYTGSLPSAMDGTLSFTTPDASCTFTETPQFQSLAQVTPAPPASIELVNGAVSFVIDNCAVGATVNVSMDYGVDLPSDATVWKAGEPWREIASANINGSVVSYSVTDGGVNDEDGVANGIIVDPFAAAAPAAPVQSSHATPVPTLPLYGMLMTILGLMLVAGTRLAKSGQA